MDTLLYTAKIACPNTSPNTSNSRDFTTHSWQFSIFLSSFKIFRNRGAWPQVSHPGLHPFLTHQPLFQMESFTNTLLMLPGNIMQYATCKEHPIIFSGIFYYESGLHGYWNLLKKPDAFAVSFWRISVVPWPEHTFGFGERKKQFLFPLFISTLIVPSENDLQSTGAYADMC